MLGLEVGLGTSDYRTELADPTEAIQPNSACRGSPQYSSAQILPCRLAVEHSVGGEFLCEALRSRSQYLDTAVTSARGLHHVGSSECIIEYNPRIYQTTDELDGKTGKGVTADASKNYSNKSEYLV